MNKEIVLATHNKNKVKEYREMLSPLGYVLYSLGDLNIEEEPTEDGKSYSENAYIKAKAVRSLVKWPVIADDSGIEIAALGDHFPGIYSARWAKEVGGGDYALVDQKVLDMLQDKKDRSAEYHCSICLLEDVTSKPLFFEGVCKGHILTLIKGNHGFGYDPIFHSDEKGLDFGLCSEEEKNTISHRAKALAKLVVYLAI